MRTTFFGIALLAVPLVSAQSHQHGPITPSALALQQVRDVERAAAGQATSDGARAAGYEPVLGWIAMMGTHWVHGPRMLEGRSAAVTAPAQLMFSPVGGKDTLVGVAYAYYAPLRDAPPPPVIFDGAPPWHDHPNLAPPGTNLMMLHVWFVASPDGPFADLNPYLPYWAVGVTPPDVERMRDPVMNERVRRAALAFAEVADPAGMFPLIARRPPVRAVLEERRAAVRALVGEIEAAHTAKDEPRWSALLETVGGHWQAMREAYLKSAIDPDVNARLAKSMDDMIKGGHVGSHR